MDNQSLLMSIENLYEVFAKYPLKKIHHSPLGQRGEFVASLYKTPLRELTAEEMDYYSYKAMSTIGDTEDFKHFLPRIFEIIAQDYLIGEVSVLSNLTQKLKYGEWVNWNKTEISSIENFFMEWIRFFLDYKTDSDLNPLYWVDDVVKDITPYLKILLENVTTEKIIELKHFMIDYYLQGYPATMFEAEFKTKTNLAFDWLISPPTVLMLETLFNEDRNFEQLPELTQLLELIYNLQKQK